MLFATVFDIINLEGGHSAVNELLHALKERREATLALRSSSKEDAGRGVFLLEVSEICLELDNTGVFRLDGETSIGKVGGHLKVTNSVGEVGRITIAM